MAYWTRRNIVKNTLGLLLLPVVLHLMIRWFESKQVFQPSRRLDSSGDSLGRPWEDVYFNATDGTRLNGWFFPGPPEAAVKKRAILLCHGNAGNISHRLLTCRALLDLGVSVFVFDYRGYGRSSGSPTESGTYLDAEAAYDWMRQRGFGPKDLVIFGESLGGAIATELALRRPVLGLILVSTFTSVPAVGAELFPWLPVRWMCRIQYDTLSKLPNLSVPVLIMHSQSDTVINYRHGQSLFAAAREPKMQWEIFGDHNDTLQDGPNRSQEGIRRFLASLTE